MKFQLPRRINYLLALVATLFVMQVFFRIMFWTMVSNLPLSFDSHLMQAFWVGVRFDLRLSVLAALLTIPLLLLPRFSAVHYATLKVLLKWWVAVILFVVLAVFCLDAGNYLYLGKRLDASIVRFASDMSVSAVMVWQSYPVMWIVLGMATSLTLLLWLHNKMLLPILERQQKSGKWWLNSGYLLVFGALLLLALVGRWSLVPLRWNHAFFNGDSEVAALGLNPFIWVYDTSKFTNKKVGVRQLKPYFENLKIQLGEPFPSLSGAALDRLYTPVAPVISLGQKQPNVVVVFLESLGTTHIGAYGNPLNPTPHVDKLLQSSRWYPNFIVPVRSTAKSVFASITGIPDVTATSTATRNPYMSHQRSVVNSLTNHKKYYMLGGSAGWANMSATVYNSIHGVELFEEKDWQSEITDVWGISDMSLIRESTDILKASELPFFAYIQTAANHRPFTIANDDTGFNEIPISASQALGAGFANSAQYNAVRLLDHNVHMLLQTFKDKGLYDDTIFVFFGDHQGYRERVDFMPEYIYQFGISDLQVPLIIHAPKYLSGERDETYGNLTDLLPTIAGLFPLPFLNTTLGRDLAWAKNKGLPTYGFSQEERTSVMLNSTEIASVNHITGEIKSAFIDEHGKAHYMAQKSQFAEYAQAYYKAAQYLLRANVEPR